MATILDCKKVQSRLGEYIDSVLPESEAWGIHLHLSSCAVCSKVAEGLSTTATLLRNLPAHELSADFDEKLAARLADCVLAPQKPGFRDWLASLWETRRPALVTSGLAAAAAMGALGILVIDRPASVPVRGVATRGAESAPLTQAWREHASAASSEAFGDSSGLLLASAERGSAGL
jgi:hypothetical protein